MKLVITNVGAPPARDGGETTKPTPTCTKKATTPPAATTAPPETTTTKPATTTTHTHKTVTTTTKSPTLPITGASPGPTIVVGIGLVVLGTLVLLWVRRRFAERNA